MLLYCRQAVIGLDKMLILDTLGEPILVSKPWRQWQFKAPYPCKMQLKTTGGDQTRFSMWGLPAGEQHSPMRSTGETEGVNGEGMLRPWQIPEPAQETLKGLGRGRFISPPPFPSEGMPQQGLQAQDNIVHDKAHKRNPFLLDVDAMRSIKH